MVSQILHAVVKSVDAFPQPELLFRFLIGLDMTVLKSGQDLNSHCAVLYKTLSVACLILAWKQQSVIFHSSPIPFKLWM